MTETRPDFRKSLTVLREEWENCTRCELGERRKKVKGNFVFGEGTPRGLMFIGEGPGKDEEESGRPFTGKSGSLLRHVIAKLQLENYYITNAVSCRSCGQAYDSEGNPRFWMDRRRGTMVPIIVDQAPSGAQVQACLPRLYQEIYLVDPILVVALGAEATKVLCRGAVSILAESGTTKKIVIPGGGFHPLLTEKKHLWVRRVRHELIMPVEQNQVEYLMMPLLHPAYALRRQQDERHGNPIQIFAEGMKRAADIYDRYMYEVYGDHPGARDLTEEDVIHAMEQNDG